MSKKIHFIGVKGVGMAALATYAKEAGFEVTGSDNEQSFVTDPILKKIDLVATPFAVKNLSYNPDMVVISAAYDKENVELKEAKKKHLEIKTYSEALGYFSQDRQVIAVAGIHGKTTTAAMIAWILTQANLDPSFIVGAGEIKNFLTNAHFGQGDYFVLEADEYRKSGEDSTSKFLDLRPKIEIISSIEMDHPDLFSSEEAVYNAFYKFACRLPRDGFIVLCLDYIKARKLQRSLVDRNFETYGFSDGVEWKIIDFSEDEEITAFSLIRSSGEKVGPFKLIVPGEINVLNAAAAVITCLKIGVEEKGIKKYLGKFAGVKRRFEKIAEVKNVTIIDDYAHHPRSIKKTLEAAKNKFPNAKIWCIFQPHTYSRTKTLLSDFAKSFQSADKVIITDIYASERENKPTISGQDLANAVRENQRSTRFIPEWSKIRQDLADSVIGSSIIITMGAGDIYKLAEQIYQDLKSANG